MLVTALAESHVQAYRELMLEAYEHAADAFTTSAQERETEPLSRWLERVGSEAGPARSFGAWHRDDLVGAVALEFSAKPKTRHAGMPTLRHEAPDRSARTPGRAGAAPDACR
jgi:hypothetical protein